MGNGIAHVFALNGFGVNLVETSQQRAEKALETIDQNLQRMVEKEKIDNSDKNQALNNIHLFTSINEGVAEVELVVEAVPENFDLKSQVFKNVEEVASNKVIFATNTSSISITRLAAETNRPEQFIGMHFFNPVPLMPLLELVKGLETSEETYSLIEQTAEQINKTPVAAEDSPGFVSNRVLMPMINEAIFCVHEGIAEPQDVDAVMKLGMNHPMGPLRLADFIGIKTFAWIS
ncbi:MAG: 3-hydroxyacyl-CoA dehydrogenase NAD-binding domain-containing protein [Balneolaceae bacterium]|nr:3-hydroxyacyl-CoA dehydrogenase NAD-binding domain-containing protein [Balneolaceae bacterium]